MLHSVTVFVNKTWEHAKGCHSLVEQKKTSVSISVLICFCHRGSKLESIPQDEQAGEDMQQGNAAISSRPICGAALPPLLLWHSAAHGNAELKLSRMEFHFSRIWCDLLAVSLGRSAVICYRIGLLPALQSGPKFLQPSRLFIPASFSRKECCQENPVPTRRAAALHVPHNGEVNN